MNVQQSDTVQVEYHHRLGLVVKVNGEVTIFDDLQVQPYEGHMSKLYAKQRHTLSLISSFIVL